MLRVLENYHQEKSLQEVRYPARRKVGMFLDALSWGIPGMELI